MSFSGRERNKLFIQTAAGWREQGYLGGADSLLDGRVAVRADFDHDGDEDIAVANRNAPLLSIFRNESLEASKSRPPVIGLRISGSPEDRSSRDAIGAIATLEACGKQLTRAVVASDGFAGQSSRNLSFALPDCDKDPHLRVRWPSGRERRFKSVRPGYMYDVDESGPLKARAGYFRLATDGAAPSVAKRDWIKSLPRGEADVALVSLWASWCAACKRHLPRLGELDAQPDLDVIAVSVEKRDTAAVASAYQRANDIGFTLLPYDEALSPVLAGEIGEGLPPLPSSLLVTRDGTLLWAGRGLPTRSVLAAAASNATDARPRFFFRWWRWLAIAATLAFIAVFAFAQLRRR